MNPCAIDEVIIEIARIHDAIENGDTTEYAKFIELLTHMFSNTRTYPIMLQYTYITVDCLSQKMCDDIVRGFIANKSISELRAKFNNTFIGPTRRDVIYKSGLLPLLVYIEEPLIKERFRFIEKIYTDVEEIQLRVMQSICIGDYIQSVMHIEKLYDTITYLVIYQIDYIDDLCEEKLINYFALHANTNPSSLQVIQYVANIFPYSINSIRKRIQKIISNIYDLLQPHIDNSKLHLLGVIKNNMPGI